MKIFGIGFHKTGTKSLADALHLLGYRVTGPNGVLDPEIASNVYELADRLAAEYDAFQDNPWPILYKYLDQRWPEAKFILTIRPADRWIGSVMRHFAGKHTPMREWIYGVGSPVGNEQLYLDRYAGHNAEVLEYFADRPDDLLVLRLTEGEGWEQLCPFLGHDIPGVPFPHSNSAQDRQERQAKMTRMT